MPAVVPALPPPSASVAVLLPRGSPPVLLSSVQGQSFSPPEVVNVPVAGPAGPVGPAGTLPGPTGPQGPTGPAGPPGFAGALLMAQASGGSQALSVFSAQVLEVSLTVETGGTYLVFGGAEIGFDSLVFSSPSAARVEVRVNGNPVAHNWGSLELVAGSSAYPRQLVAQPFPVVLQAGDLITLWGKLTIAPAGGTVTLYQCSVSALLVA